MSDFLIEAILRHHNQQVKDCSGLLLASKCGNQWYLVSGFTLKQLKEYLNTDQQ